MNDCHSSKKLDSLIGTIVKITFFDGKEEIGILRYPDFGNGYLLVGFMNCDTRFYKSHVRKITEVR